MLLLVLVESCHVEFGKHTMVVTWSVTSRGRYHVSHTMLNHRGHDVEVSATWRVGVGYIVLVCQPRGIRVSSVGHIIVSLSFVPHRALTSGVEMQ